MVGDGEDKRKAARDKDTKEMADRGRDELGKNSVKLKKRGAKFQIKTKEEGNYRV